MRIDDSVEPPETRDTAGSPYVVAVTATNAAGTDSQDVEIEVTRPRGNPNGSQGASFRAR